MQLLALFTPEDDAGRRWRVRVFPYPASFEIPGLSTEGEYVGLGRPHFDDLDWFMLESKSAYRLRRHANGIAEVTASSPTACEALSVWVSSLIAEAQRPPPWNPAAPDSQVPDEPKPQKA